MTNAASRRPQQKAQSSATASTLAVLGAITTTVANFLIAWLVTRESTRAAGVFFTATAAISIAGNASSLGTQTGVIYFLPRALDARVGAGHVVWKALAPVLVLSTMAAALLVLGAPALAAIIADGDADFATIVRVGAIAVPGFAASVTLFGAARGLGTMTPTVLLGQVVRPGLQIAAMLVLFVTDTASATSLALAWAVPVLISAIGAFATVRRLGGLDISPAQLASDTAGAASNTAEAVPTWSEFWRYTRPRSVSTALQIALERSDVILVSAFLGRELAGVYGTLTRYISAGSFLMFSVSQAVAPALRRALNRNEVEQAQRLLSQATSWLILVAWPYFLLLAFHHQTLGSFYGPGFVPDADILVILAFGMMFSAGAGPIDLALLMLGRSTASMVGTIVAIVIDVVLIVVLTPTLGLAGAAWAWVAAVVAQNGLATVLVHRTAGLRSWDRRATLAATAALAVTSVPSAIILVLLGPSLGSLLLSGVIAGLGWLGAVVRLARPLGLDDVLPVGRLTNAKSRPGSVTPERADPPSR